METTGSSVGTADPLDCRRPRLLEGLHIRILVRILIEGRGFIDPATLPAELAWPRVIEVWFKVP